MYIYYYILLHYIILYYIIWHYVLYTGTYTHTWIKTRAHACVHLYFYICIYMYVHGCIHKNSIRLTMLHHHLTRTPKPRPAMSWPSLGVGRLVSNQKIKTMFNVFVWALWVLVNPYKPALLWFRQAETNVVILSYRLSTHDSSVWIISIEATEFWGTSHFRWIHKKVGSSSWFYIQLHVYMHIIIIIIIFNFYLYIQRIYCHYFQIITIYLCFNVIYPIQCI